jgi:hypothetical protein
MRKLLLSTVVLGAWSGAALADPAALVPMSAMQEAAVAVTGQQGRDQQAQKKPIELSEAQMDRVTAGYESYQFGIVTWYTPSLVSAVVCYSYTSYGC